jgi:hypothetical protein
VTVALIAVVVLALGLALVAWRLRGRRLGFRPRPGARPDPWGDAIRRFGLTPQEALQVEAAVNRGRRLEDPRLRQAAVAWAQQIIDHTPRLRFDSRWARRAFVAVWLAVVAAFLTWLAVRREPFPWVTLVVTVVIQAVFARLARGPHRALQLNSEPASDTDQQPSTTGDGGTAE